MTKTAAKTVKARTIKAKPTGKSPIDRLVAQVQAAGIDLPPKEIRDRIYGISAAAMPASRPIPLDVLSPKIKDGPLADKLRAACRKLAGSFSKANEPGSRTARLAALRKVLKAKKLDGFVVPLSDEHQSEYVSWHAARLAWLTGFSGSAGIAVVLPKTAAIFVDGRYVLQVGKQVDPKLFKPIHSADQSPYDWIGLAASKGARIGYDPWLHTERQVTWLKQGCEKAGAELVAVDRNPVDEIWDDQPPPPLGRIIAHETSLAGETAAHKRERIARVLREKVVAAAFLSAPDSIAWLLNVRGNDAPCTPLPNSFAIVDAGGTINWFVDARKLTNSVVSKLGKKAKVHECVEALFEGQRRRAGRSFARTVLGDPATREIEDQGRARRGSLHPAQGL